MTYAQKIIDLFGGVRPASRELNLPTSTVYGWWNRGSIPDNKKRVVLAAAEKKGLKLTKEDFFPSEPAE